MSPVFFSAPARFRTWLEKNHDKVQELWVGFHKVGTGIPSITWPQSVDEALCFGWIDGLRKRVDEESYVIRFTPRKPGSTWSLANIRRVEKLVEEGRMHPSGMGAFEKRREDRSGIYSFEQRGLPRFEETQEKLFRRNARAWAYFSVRPPSYRKSGDPLGRQRQEGGDPARAASPAHRGFGEREAHSSPQALHLNRLVEFSRQGYPAMEGQPPLSPRSLAVEGRSGGLHVDRAGRAASSRRSRGRR